MHQNLDEKLSGNVDVICGDISKVMDVQPLSLFSDCVIEFLNALSKKLMSVKAHSDVATFGFWCRKAALLKERRKYDDKGLSFGRGVLFHVAPSNVPVNFAFSLVAGMLAGNANIVRLPSKDFEQTSIITSAITELLNGEFTKLLPYICIIRYPINKDVSDVLSLICDVRIIWGGDATISELRKSPLKPRAKEITFADRHSIAVINADEYLKAIDKVKIARDFYNDTYFSDQNACTSPRILFWLGVERVQAKEKFYGILHELTATEYQLTEVQALGKLAALYKAAAGINAIHIHDTDNLIMRVAIDKLNRKVIKYKYNSGFFLEYDINSLSELLPVCDERCQTISYFGISKVEIANFMKSYSPRGVDRIVPLGRTMDFSLVWDGYDLISELSRKLTLQ